MTFDGDRLGRGDFVQATEATSHVPKGTVGKVLATTQTRDQRSLHIEWNMRQWPYVKKEWHPTSEVERLKEDLP